MRAWVHAQGPCPPSSESLTHGAIYDADLAIGAVVHGHDARLWQWLLGHGAPHTPEEVTYGTVAMARAAFRVVREAGRRPWRLPGVLAMAGHEDGVVAWGRDAREATDRLLAAWGASRCGGPVTT